MSDPDPQRACFGKKRYSTEDIAATVAANCFEQRGVRLRVYRCDYASCGGYHLSSKGVAHDVVEPKPGWRVAKIGEREMARRRHIEQRHGRRRR